jgi:hypothetical protein
METRVQMSTQARKPKEEGSDVQARKEHERNARTRSARALSTNKEVKRFVLEKHVHDAQFMDYTAHCRTCKTSAVSAT